MSQESLPHDGVQFLRYNTNCNITNYAHNERKKSTDALFTPLT